MDFPVPERVKSELEQLVDWAWPYVEKEFKGMPKDKFKRAERAAFYSHRIPDRFEKYKFLTLYEINSGCYWHATDFWLILRKELPKEKLEFYANAIIEQAKVGGCHADRNSDYAWIVLKHYDGTLTDFIDDELLKEAVNRGFWEFAEHELTGHSHFASLKYYQAIIAYKDLIEIKGVPLEKPLRATCLEKRDKHGHLVGGLLWPDENYIELVDKFKDQLPEDDAAKLIRPILELAIRIAFHEEFIGDPAEELEKEFEPHKEYLSHQHIQDLFKEYIGKYAGYLDAKFELLLPYWNASEEEVKTFVSENVKDCWLLDFLEEKFPVKYLTNELKQDLQSKLIKELSEHPKWDKSIVPHISSWGTAVQLGYVPEDIAKEFIENKIKKYLERKRVSKQCLRKLYPWLPNFISDELKDEIRARAEIELEPEKAPKPEPTQKSLLDF